MNAIVITDPAKGAISYNIQDGISIRSYMKYLTEISGGLDFPRVATVTKSSSRCGYVYAKKTSAWKNVLGKKQKLLAKQAYAYENRLLEIYHNQTGKQPVLCRNTSLT